MRRLQFLLLPIALVLVTPMPSPVAAACPTTSHFASDASFQAFQPEPAINFVAEGRIGDRGGAATFELDLGQSTAAPATQAQYNWISGQAEPFTLSYNNISGVVTFQLGGRTLNYSPGATFTDIYIRTRATQAGTSVVVNNLVLDGCGIVDQSGATGDGLDYLRLAGGTLGDGFVLTGNATLTWGVTPPANSHLAFQIKVGTPATIVPVESATWSSVKTGPGR